ncbi:MAG: LytR C-terminal domain-containing protein [Actinomycetaceae bacterium]|nr:LytR C-terminal domain-containing protein [Actinomycetaceae bacterium]
MAENEYPQDEFDRLAARRAIRGTHRRKESMLKWWIALALIVILAPAAGWGIVQFWGSQGGSSGSDRTSSAPATSQSSEGQEPSSSSNGESTSPSVTGSSDPSSDPSQSSSSDPSQSVSGGGVQTDRRVLVLNGAGKTGLAAEKQKTLSGQGFSNVSVDNYAGGSPTVSTVFYPKDEDRPTAAAIANSLGISESQIEMAPSATGGDQIVVVLKGDIDS